MTGAAMGPVRPGERTPGVVRGIAQAALDLAFGTACVGCGVGGVALCRPCATDLLGVVRPVRYPRHVVGVPLVVAWPYSGTARAAVLAHKEQRWPLAGVLGAGLAAAIGPRGLGVATARGPGCAMPRGAGRCATHLRAPVLVPIPSRPAAIRARGHDSVAELARAAGAALGRPAAAATSVRRGASCGDFAAGCAAVHAVLRSRASHDQVGLDDVARAANLRGAVRVVPRRADRVPGPVVVVDDVVTSGATLRAAVVALERAGVEVLGAVAVAAPAARVPVGTVAAC